jgi:uncharacterized Zn-binding protein involved in type VI secretion
MPGPAARVGDSTAHGGVISPPGCPTVLIGGMPAARVTDMQICPMVTPAPAPVPHASGPISGPGVPTVLIGGMPAATIGDMTVCVGPPGTIIVGCPTVLIGTGGGGSGGAGGGAVKAAWDGAHSSLVGQPSPEAEGLHWIEYQFVDSAGNPVTEVPYEFTGVDGHKEKGILTKNGVIKRGGLPKAGNCTVRLFSVYNAKWSKNTAREGDILKLSADAEGYEDGTRAVLEIWEKDIKGPDYSIAFIESAVKGKKVEAEWTYEYEEGRDEGSEEDERKGYSSPEYYFIVHVENEKARSDLLAYQDWIEIELKDQDDKSIPNEKYVLYLPTGEIRKGKLDGNGFKREEKVPPGKYRVEFPDIGD